MVNRIQEYEIQILTPEERVYIDPRALESMTSIGETVFRKVPKLVEVIEVEAEGETNG